MEKIIKDQHLDTVKNVSYKFIGMNELTIVKNIFTIDNSSYVTNNAVIGVPFNFKNYTENNEVKNILPSYCCGYIVLYFDKKGVFKNGDTYKDFFQNNKYIIATKQRLDDTFNKVKFKLGGRLFSGSAVLLSDQNIISAINIEENTEIDIINVKTVEEINV